MFVYEGDPNDPGGMPESTTVYGHHFPKGQPVRIDAALGRSKVDIERKLSANSHFRKLDKDEAATVMAEIEAVAKVRAEAAAKAQAKAEKKRGD